MKHPSLDLEPLEERLQAALRAWAEWRPVETPDSLPPRSHHAPHRPRRLRLAAAALAFAAVVLGVVAALERTNDKTHRVSTRPTPDSTATTAVELPDDGFPRFLLDLRGVRLRAALESLDPPYSLPLTPAGELDRQLFRTPDAVAGPWLEIINVPRAPREDELTDLGFRVSYPGDSESAEKIDVAGHVAYLWHHDDTVNLSIRWDAVDGGRGVIVNGLRLSTDDVLAITEGLRPREDGSPFWDTGPLPSGLASVGEGAPSFDTQGGQSLFAVFSTSDRAEIPGYALGRDGRSLSVTLGGEMEDYSLNVSSGDAFEYEQSVLAQLRGGGTSEAVTVGGRPGLLTKQDPDRGWAGFVLTWRPTDTTVATLSGPAQSQDKILATIDALRFVSRAEWRAALPRQTLVAADVGTATARLQAETALPAPATWEGIDASRYLVVDRDALASLMDLYAACAWQEEWLTAMDAADTARAQRAVEAITGIQARHTNHGPFAVPGPAADTLTADNIESVRQNVKMLCGGTS